MTAFFARRRKAREAGDVAALLADYAEDCVLEAPGAGSIVGRAAIEEWFRKAVALLPDLESDDEDLIVMEDRTFSDGVTEAVNQDEEDFGDDRLIAWAMAHRDQEPSTFVASLLAEVRSFCGDTVQGDDLTCLALRYSGAR
jgi:ketosteroid isomerase-like protein